MSPLVRWTKTGEIAIVTIDNPPVNALSPGVPEGILACLEELNADPEVEATVLIGAGRTFIAGADIHELSRIASGERSRDLGLQPAILALENSPKPVICAIHGTALGGGLEFAMGAHYRVAAPSARLGQPEIRLGLIPGAGGTQRLPRLVGVEKAVEMCSLGQPVSAAEALQCGLVDRLIEGDLLEGALAFAREMLAHRAEPPKTRDRAVSPDDPTALAPVFDAARDAARKRIRGQQAPLRAIEAIGYATSASFEEGLRQEARLFEECLFSDESRALIHVFFAERATGKGRRDCSSVPCGGCCRSWHHGQRYRHGTG